MIWTFSLGFMAALRTAALKDTLRNSKECTLHKIASCSYISSHSHMQTPKLLHEDPLIWPYLSSNWIASSQKEGFGPYFCSFTPFCIYTNGCNKTTGFESNAPRSSIPLYTTRTHTHTHTPHPVPSRPTPTLPYPFAQNPFQKSRGMSNLFTSAGFPSKKTNIPLSIGVPK